MIIGIDLGTSTSEVAFLRNGKPHLIRELRGSARGILPSIVGVNTKGAIIVGEDIAAQLIMKPDLAVQEVKRKMGSGEKIRLGAEEYTPQEVSAFILRHIKDEAERYLGKPVTGAVITVPAYFTDVQRRATEDAGELAGLTVHRLVAEPTAAALAYGLERSGGEELVAVYDLGGGTLDVSILELSEGVLEVLASTGNSKLGGKDFDERLMAFVATECRRANGIELLAAPRSRQRLKVECKRAKEALSFAETATIALENLGVRADGLAIDFDIEITRAQFTSLIQDLVASTREQLDEALGAKGLSADRVNTVLLIGGSTRIPAVHEFVASYFPGRRIATEVAPDEAVALGASIQAGILDGTIDSSTFVITDVISHTLGIAISRDIDDERVSGFFDPLIEKQSTIPRTAKKRYETTRDWQDAVAVRVFQGDATMAEDNEPVIEFRHPMKPAPAGAEVDIEFSYNLNGMVEIVARDCQTGVETRKVVRPAKLRMSELEKDQARVRLETLWTRGKVAESSASANSTSGAVDRAAPTSSAQNPKSGFQESPLYPKVAALITFAEKQLASLTGAPRAQVEGLLNALKTALIANDPSTLDSHERKLTDVLFELS